MPLYNLPLLRSESSVAPLMMLKKDDGGAAATRAGDLEPGTSDHGSIFQEPMVLRPSYCSPSNPQRHSLSRRRPAFVKWMPHQRAFTIFGRAYASLDSYWDSLLTVSRGALP